MWTSDVQLWENLKVFSIEIIQRYQFKALKTVTNVPWFIANATSHRDFQSMLRSKKFEC